MWDIRRYSTLLLTLLWTCLAPGVLAQTPLPTAPVAAPAPNGPPPGVIALRNGEVFQGGVVLAGQEYIVVLPQGELRFKTADVEHCCATMPEVYACKRAGVAASDALEHLRLAQWCLRQGLFDEAAVELDDAARLQPEHPMLPLLKQRIDLLRHPPPPPKEPPPTPSAITSDVLDRLVRGLPEGSVEAFTQRVQPVLLNHCATAGCHGPQSTATMQLFRVGAASVSRRTTQRNLHSVLQWVTRENPPGSPLLTAPSQAHGPAKAAIFTDRESVQFRKLEEWVYQVSGKTPPIAPQRISLHGYVRPGSRGPSKPGDDASEPAADAPLPPPVTINADTFGKAPAGAVKAASHQTPQTNTKTPAGAKSSKANATPPREVNVVVGQQPPGLIPALPARPTGPGGRDVQKPAVEPIPAGDPFDPELFNRRFAAPPH